jgi:hypothetical protein
LLVTTTTGQDAVQPYGLSHDLKTAAAEKFLLTTLPTALGAGARLPCTFAVAKFGGRNWTVVSASLLLVPLVVLPLFGFITFYVICVGLTWLFYLRAAARRGLVGV